MALSEFSLIERYFSGLGGTRPDILLGVGDDAALIDTGSPEALAVCVDTLVAGVHFPENAPPETVGHKLLAVNLSDLAAMGARPSWALLALTLPSADPNWLAGFQRGFQALAATHGVALIGGDTTRGSLSASLTLAGTVPAEAALRRDKAAAGDLIYVTGSLGEAAAGLKLWQAGRGGQAPALVERLHRPSARVEAGLALRGIARAAIDVSDGLAADLGHILARSSVGARVEVAELPLSRELLSACGPVEALAFALSGGDDYELCFTVPPERAEAVESVSRRLGLTMTRIGVIEAEPGLRAVTPDGRELPLDKAGFDHFGSGR